MAKAKKEAALTPEERLQAALVPDWEWPYKLPENWCWVHLSALANMISKGTTPSGGKDAYVTEGVKFLRVENISDDGTISHEGIAHITEDMHTVFLKRSILHDKDILVSIAGTLGRTGIVRTVDLPINTNQAVAFIRLKDARFLPEYIKTAIDNPVIQELLISQTKVTSIPNLTLEIISNCFIPLPPLAEQQRIVYRIESLFAKLDEAKEKVQEVVDGYEARKAAILHKAFTGELTGKKNHSSILLEEIVDVIRIGPFGSSLHKDDYVIGGTPIINPKHILNQKICPDENVSVSNKAKAELKRYVLRSGDIIMGRRGEMGRCAAVTEKEDGWLCGTGSMIIRLKDGFDATFYSHIIASNISVRYLEENSVGSTMKNLNEKIVRGIPVPSYTVDEQQQIVRILDDLFAKEQLAHETALATLDQIDIIKKSILARVFRGELGTNDPNDEPAVELLKKVLDLPAEPKPKAKRKFIPKELDAQIKTDLERKIIKKYIQNETDCLTMNQLMGVSSKRFDIMETLRNLQNRGILIKENDIYKLMG